MTTDATVFVLANLAAGCALRGPYVAPDTAPATVAADADTFALQPYDPAWWREFDDPILLQLEEAALAANHDVAAAVARLDQARAFFSEIKRDRYPRVTVGASVDRREQAAPGFSDEPIDTTTYQAGFDAFWEIDLFGRVR